MASATYSATSFTTTLVDQLNAEHAKASQQLNEAKALVANLQIEVRKLEALIRAASGKTQGMTGRTLSPESRAKLSAALKATAARKKAAQAAVTAPAPTPEIPEKKTTKK